MPKNNKEITLCLEELKMFINGSEYKEIALKYNIKWQTMSQRVYRTYNFLEKILVGNKIEYPTRKYGGHKMLIARENKEFWLKIIADYEKGVLDFVKKPKRIDSRITHQNNEKAFRNYSLKAKGYVNMQEKEIWDNAVQWAINRLGAKINIFKEEVVEEGKIDVCES